MAEITTDTVRKTRGRQIRRGLTWNAGKLFVDKGLSLVVRLLLARLLVPEHFGLIAMIVVALGLIKLFVDFGLKTALIQRRRDECSLIRYDSAFWFLLGAGIGWTALFMIAGVPLLIWLYGEPQLHDLALVMSVSILVHSISALPLVRLSRRMRFKPIVIAEVTSHVVAAAIAIAMAFGGGGVWALAAQQLVSVGLRSALLWRFARWRPRWRFSWSSLRDLFGFSGWMMGSQVIHYLRKNMDKMLVGAMLGASALGVYVLAFVITEALRAKIGQAINTVMFPAYSHSQNDLAEVRRLYLAVVRYNALVVFPAAMLLILFADPVVPVLFGAAWAGTVEPLRILAFASMIHAISGDPASVLRGLGRPKVSFTIQLWNTTLVALPAIVLGIMYFGLAGAAWSVVISYTASRIAFQVYFRRIGFLTEAAILMALWPALAVALAMVALFNVSSIMMPL